MLWTEHGELMVILNIKCINMMIFLRVIKWVSLLENSNEINSDFNSDSDLLLLELITINLASIKFQRITIFHFIGSLLELFIDFSRNYDSLRLCSIGFASRDLFRSDYRLTYFFWFIVKFR